MVRKRRFAQVSTSEDEDDDYEVPKRERRSSSRRKNVLLDDDSDDDEEYRLEETKIDKSKNSSPAKGAVDEDEEAEEEEEEAQAFPIGDPIRVSGKGSKKKKHYRSFEYEGNVFELEDPVLLTPATEDEKPYVAIIKDISDLGSGLMVTGQWFYRPEEAKIGTETWTMHDTRELFYSFHLDDVPAESVMHRCVVHFVPLNKKLPIRSQHPGFIIQKVYDIIGRKLWKFTDREYEDCKKDEINQLVKKTMDRIGELSDIEPEDAATDRCDQPLSKWNLRRKNTVPIDTSKADGACSKLVHLPKADVHASCRSDASEYHVILAKFKALTGNSSRDKWLEKLLQGIQSACNSKEEASKENEEKGSAALTCHHANDNRGEEKRSDAGEKVCWPDTAVAAITELEKASQETLGGDFYKYNQKMRQLYFNLRNNALLARRLLNKELVPAVILSMSPNELKDGLTADENATKEPDESECMQMTDALCTRCTEKRAAITDVIYAGGHGNRYQLECQACGHSWYASVDDISTLTIDAPNATRNVSPHDPEKLITDVLEKSTPSDVSALETHDILTID